MRCRKDNLFCNVKDRVRDNDLRVIHVINLLIYLFLVCDVVSLSLLIAYNLQIVSSNSFIHSLFFDGSNFISLHDTTLLLPLIIE